MQEKNNKTLAGDLQSSEAINNLIKKNNFHLA